MGRAWRRPARCCAIPTPSGFSPIAASGISGLPHHSASTGARTNSGPMEGCSTRRRSADSVRDAILQGLALGLTVTALWWLGHNAVASLERHGISLGFGFLRQPANFAIGDTVCLYF